MTSSTMVLTLAGVVHCIIALLLATRPQLRRRAEGWFILSNLYMLFFGFAINDKYSGAVQVTCFIGAVAFFAIGIDALRQQFKRLRERG